MQGPLAGTAACKFSNAAGETDPGYDACMVSLSMRSSHDTFLIAVLRLLA